MHSFKNAWKIVQYFRPKQRRLLAVSYKMLRGSATIVVIQKIKTKWNKIVAFLWCQYMFLPLDFVPQFLIRWSCVLFFSSMKKRSAIGSRPVHTVVVFPLVLGHYYQLKGSQTFTRCLLIHTSRLHSLFTSTSVQFAERLQQFLM